MKSIVVKKKHTVKNTLIATRDKVIRFVGHTFCGRHHDYTMLKAEFPLSEQWFETVRVFVDLGYQGIVSDYSNEGIQIPHKKPRKSQAHPNPRLTDEQKAENRALSQIRILIENAIGGLKRYNILNHRFRNRRHHFDDEVIVISAGLWNFLLAPTPSMI